MTICGADCTQCALHQTCRGCEATGGRPFGGRCVVAECCRGRGQKTCADCARCTCRQKLMAECNALQLQDAPPVTELFALNGALVNLEYPLPGGQRVKFWKDQNIYLGTQVPKAGSDRCYGFTADEEYLLVCEYGPGGAQPQIVALQRRKQSGGDGDGQP